MGLLEKTCGRIEKRDAAIFELVSRRWHESETNGSFGKLVDLVATYAAATGRELPELPRPCMVIACADHGVTEMGVSAYPKETTIGMTRSYLIHKGAGANALGNYCGSHMEVVDMGIDADLSDVPGLRQHKLGGGTKNYLKEPAMTRAQAIEGIETGIALAHEMCDKGYDTFLVGEMGISNTTAAALIVAKFAGLTAEEATGRGTNISDERLTVKQRVVRDTLAKYEYVDRRDGLEILRTMGGFEFTCLVGIMLGAAERHAITVIDGFNTTACALVAESLAPNVTDYLMSSHLSAEKAHTRALKQMNLEAYVDLGLCLGEASGGSVQTGMLEAAVRLYRKAIGHPLPSSSGIAVEGGETIIPIGADTNGVYIAYRGTVLIGELIEGVPSDDVSQVLDFKTDDLPGLDADVMERCRYRIDNLIKPIYSLAHLELTAERLAGITGDERPEGLAAQTVVFSKSDVDEDAVGTGIRAARALHGRGVRVAGLGHEGGVDAEVVGRVTEALLAFEAIFDTAGEGLAKADELITQAAGVDRVEDANLLKAMAAFVLTAASLRMAVVFDDSVTGAAIMTAVRVAPKVKDYVFASLVYRDGVQSKQLEAMARKAFLHYDLTAVGGIGSMLGISILDAALYMLNDMKTFTEAAVAVAEDGPGNNRQVL